MKEQSHKDEMSAAIRGDFERLRARGVPAALVPQEDPDPADPSDSSAPSDRPDPSDNSGPSGAPPGGEQPPPPHDADPAERHGWLGRLTGR